MIRQPQTDNLFEADVDAIVITVNCVGVAGKGVAKDARERDTQWFEGYNRLARAKKIQIERETYLDPNVSGKPFEKALEPGALFVFDRGAEARPRYWISVPTKDHWRDDSKAEYIERGTQALRAFLAAPAEERINLINFQTHVDQNNILQQPERVIAINSIALPPLGAGNGNLDWNVSKPIIEKALADLPVDVVLYEPRERTQGRSTNPQYNALFDTPAERPPLPASGQWHQNWFSNMIEMETPLIEDGIAYRTVEAYYQASKVASPEKKKELADMRPHQSKRAVRGMVQDPNWNIDVGYAAMKRALEHKFGPGTNALDQLLATGTNEIVEFNNWSDRTWGRTIEDGQGRNLLGQALMEVRRDARERIETRTATQPSTAAPTVGSSSFERELLKELRQSPNSTATFRQHVAGAEVPHSVLEFEDGRTIFSVPPIDNEQTVRIAAHVDAHNARIAEAQLANAPTLTMNGIWPAPFTTAVTMIGARAATAAKFPTVAAAQKQFGASCEQAGLIGRSGAAIGSDENFMSGYTDPRAHGEIYLPAKTIEERVNKAGKPYVQVVDNRAKKPGEIVFHPSRDGVYHAYAQQLAQSLHPNPSNLGPVALELWTRNIPQYLGRTLDNPSLFVAEWAPPLSEHRVDGGSNCVHTLAREMGGAIFNAHPKAGDFQRLAEARRAIDNRDMQTLSMLLDQQRERHQVKEVGLTDTTTLKARQTARIALAALANENGQGQELSIPQLTQLWGTNRLGPDGGLMEDPEIANEIIERLELDSRDPKRISAAERAEMRERILTERFSKGGVPLLRPIRDARETRWAMQTVIEQLNGARTGDAHLSNPGRALLNAIDGYGYLSQQNEHAYGKLVVEPVAKLSKLDTHEMLSVEANGHRYVIEGDEQQLAALAKLNGQNVAIYRDGSGRTQAIPMERTAYDDLAKGSKETAVATLVQRAMTWTAALETSRAQLRVLDENSHAFGVLTRVDREGASQIAFRSSEGALFGLSPRSQDLFANQAGLVGAVIGDEFGVLTNETYEQAKNSLADLRKAVRNGQFDAAMLEVDQLENEGPDQKAEAKIGSKERPIILDVINAKTLDAGPHENTFYLGRTRSIAESLGLPHLQALSNPHLTEKAGGTLTTSEAAKAFEPWFKEQLAPAEGKTRNAAVAKDFLTFVNNAVRTGSAIGVCHDHPDACHVDTIVREGAKLLRNRGYEVITPGLNFKEIEHYQDRISQALERRIESPLNKAATEKLIDLGHSASQITELHTPWERIEGTVIAEDKTGFAVEVGNGQFRSVKQEHFPQPFEVGDTARLQMADGRPIEPDPRARTTALENVVLGGR